MAGRLGPATIVTDAGSTKQDVIAAARAALGAAFARFVPAHPIAGTEHSGAAAAFATLFRDRNVVLTPVAETDPRGDGARRARCGQACGARVRTLGAGRRTTGSSRRCRTCRTCSRSRWSTPSPTRPDARRSSASPPAAFATSPASRRVRRRCGATSRSPIATRCWPRSRPIRAQLDRVTAMLEAGDGAGARGGVRARARRAAGVGGALARRRQRSAADGPREPDGRRADERDP